MRFQQGQSGNPSGRPRGALNRATVLAQELLSARVESIAGKLIELAESGDMRAIRVCMERLMPVIKHQPIAVELPPIENAADSVEAVAHCRFGRGRRADGNRGRRIGKGRRCLRRRARQQRVRRTPEQAREGDQRRACRAGAFRGRPRHGRLRDAAMPPAGDWLMKLTKTSRLASSSGRREDNRWSQRGAAHGDPLFPIVFNNGARNQDL